MKTKTFGLALIFLVFFIAISAQDMTVKELTKKVNELERRIAMLEKIILENSPSSTKETIKEPTKNMPADKVNWRKLRVGMNESEVRSLLGESLQIERLAPFLNTWYYANTISHSKVVFDNKGVSGWTEPQ